MLNIKTANLQGKEMTKEVYVRPLEEAKRSRIWQLRKTVYGLKYAARHWYESLMEVLKDMGGRRSAMDGTLITWKNEKGLYGIMCTHLDDLFFRGNNVFHKVVISRMNEKLKMGAQKSTQFKYLGINVVDEENGWAIMDQNEYI